jgi:hypothetical protein
MYGPVRPAAVWTLVGIVLVVAVVAWFTWVWWSTRARRGERGTALGGPHWSIDERRARALAEIDQLEAAHASGELSGRDVFQRVSPLVRWFVYESSGRPAHVHALAELRGDDDALAAEVAWMYPEEFSPDAPGAVAEGLGRARRYLVAFPGPAGGADGRSVAGNGARDGAEPAP